MQAASLRELRHFCKLFPNGEPQLTLLKMHPILGGASGLVPHTFSVKCPKNDFEITNATKHSKHHQLEIKIPHSSDIWVFAQQGHRTLPEMKFQFNLITLAIWDKDLLLPEGVFRIYGFLPSKDTAYPTLLDHQICLEYLLINMILLSHPYKNLQEMGQGIRIFSKGHRRHT